MKKIVLSIFLFIFWFNNSDAQCGGVFSISATKIKVCGEDTVTIVAGLSGGGVGWDFKIYYDSIIPARIISDTTFVIDVPGKPTKYYATADSSGCLQKKDSININVFYPSQPILTVSGDTIFCNPIYMDYQWFMNGYPIPGATNSFYVALFDSVYNVYVTDSNGCKVLKHTIILVSTNELTQLLSFSIVPNPLMYSSALYLTTDLSNAELIIYNILGKEIMRKSFSGNEVEIEKGNMESGVYFVKVRAGEKEWVEKLMVE